MNNFQFLAIPVALLGILAETALIASRLPH